MSVKYLLSREQIVDILTISRLPVGTISDREAKERRTSEWLEGVLATMMLVDDANNAEVTE